MAPDPHQQPSEKEQKKQQRNTKWIVLSVALVVLITAGAVIGYFVSKKNNGAASANSSNADGAASSGIATTQTTTQTGNASVSPVGSSTNSSAVSTITGSASVSTKRKLFGYYGANAIANGVDIIKGINGRTTAPTQYQGSLATYCATGYYDTINLAFLNIFGGGNNHFQITFASFSDPSLKNGLYIYNGDSKESNDATVVATFAAMGKQIQQCQAGGTKIVLSLGGDKVSAYTFVAGDGAAYATLFYNMFLGGTSTVRPFGAGVVLDGIELDVEKNDNPAVWTPEMISFITTLRGLAPKTQIAIVPQCFLNGDQNKDINVGDVISATTSSLDYIIIQYYNNPQCSYPFDFNFNKWKTLFPGTLYVGLAGDWTSAISGGFLEAGPLQAVYDMLKTDSQFGGFSVYDVSSSNPPAFSWSQDTYANPPNSTYSKTLRDVLNGVQVGSGFAPQGPAQSNAGLGMRCGGTWDNANATCSNKACAGNGDCGASEQCFMFLSKC